MYARSLVIGILFPIGAMAAAPFLGQSSFRDIPNDSPYVDAVEYARDHDIVQGYDDGTFRPNALINRAEFTKVVVAALQDPTETIECIRNAPPSTFYSVPFLFADTPVQAWYLPYLCEAKMKRIVNGYPDGTFRPARLINVAEASQIISQSFALPQAGTGTIWYESPIKALADVHALPADLESVDTPVSRGQMIEILYRLLAHVTDKSSTTYEALTK